MTSRIIDYRQESDDVIYFTASFRNNQNVPIDFRFNQARQGNILEKANDYYMAVISFDIPHEQIAIFNFRQDPYFVNIDDGTNPAPIQLEYVSLGNPFFNISASFQGVYTFQQFLDSINVGLNTAHVRIGAPGNAPRMILGLDGRFSLLVDTQYTNQVIRFNYPLFKFFLSINAVFEGIVNQEYSIPYRQIFDNVKTYPTPLVGTYYEMQQENRSQFIWSNITAISINSTLIPCKKELVGLNNLTSGAENQSISDFIPVQTEFTGYDRSNWTYLAGSGYRLVDLLSDAPLSRIDFGINVVNKDNFQFPLSISPGSIARVKFMFIKKSLENNEYNGLIDFENNFHEKVLGQRNVKRRQFA